MLENAGILEEMVNSVNAHSTDLESPEPVESLTEKCRTYAKNWSETADDLWKKSHHIPYKETHEYVMSRAQYEKEILPKLNKEIEENSQPKV